MKYKKNKNGFSLIEIVLGLGLISLAATAIYSNYSARRVSANVDRQAILLSDFAQRAMNGLSSAMNPATMATTANMISLRIAPIDMVDSGNGILTNVFGGLIEVSGTNPTSDQSNFQTPIPVNEDEAGTITFSLTDVPSNACAKLGTTPYADGAFSISVNGVLIKDRNEQPSAEQVSRLANNCILPENVMEFTHTLFNPDLLDFRVVGNDANRGKENPMNIADIGRTLVPAQECTGGSLWQVESSSCMCPATSYWNGASCITFNTGLGNCEPGFGWNGNSCVPHQKVGEAAISPNTIRQTLGDHDFGMPLGADVPNPGLEIVNGRRILRVGYPTEIVENVQTNTVLPSGPIQKNACMGSNGNWTGYHCVYCTNGSVWNDPLKRCVTTGASANDTGLQLGSEATKGNFLPDPDVTTVTPIAPTPIPAW